MEQEVGRVYEIFKKLLLKKSDICFSKEFVQLIKDGELKCESINDEILLKLAVLSSHKEWEAIYQDLHIDLDGCIGAVCRDLTKKGLNYYQITPHELEMLRNEVVDGDNKYSYYIKVVNDRTREYNDSPCLRYCRNLFHGYLELKRVKETRDCLNKLIHQHRDQTTDLDVPVLITMMYDRFYCEDDFTFEEEELKLAVENFIKFEHTNKTIGLYDPVVYTIYFINAINYYLNILQDKDWQTSGFVKVPVYSLDENAFNILKVQPRFYMSQFTDYFDGNTFLADADKDIYKLMKLHDDLIISIVPYVGDPTLYLFSPKTIFNGTETLIRRRLLHMTYPDKLEYGLCTLSDMPTTAYTPINLNEEQLKKILLEDYNTVEDIRKINDFFDPQDDEDDLEDVEQEDDTGLEEEEEEGNDGYYHCCDEDDYSNSINFKELVVSMNSPGWEETDIGSLFTKEYKRILSDLKPDSYNRSAAFDFKDIIIESKYPSELKCAACKALSLTKYEYAEVILVKVICFEETSVKHAALEALLNLKRPIDADAYRRLCECLDELDGLVKDMLKDAIDKKLILSDG